MRRRHKYGCSQRHIERKRTAAEPWNVVTYSKADFLSFEFELEILVDGIFCELQIDVRIHCLSICADYADKAAAALYEISNVKLREAPSC